VARGLPGQVPARYQWNDIRGFVAGQHHPAERDRGRLPGPIERVRARVAAGRPEEPQ
jgi:hypothetical protein